MPSRTGAFGIILAGVIALTGCGKPRSDNKPAFLDTPQREAQLAVKSTAVIVAPNGHAYKYVAAPNISWDAARRAAAGLKFRGHAGYLATIDDKAEYEFVVNKVFPTAYPGVTYLGGRQTALGEWRWVTGPDAAADGGRGVLFWKGAEQGAVQGSLFANWMATAFQQGGEWDVAKVCCVTMFSYNMPQFSTSLGSGTIDEAVTGYLVEFGN